MKEITILSGKGGTGKTTITAALASIAGHAVYCDNDVDAADLHLIFHPEMKEKHAFTSGWKVAIDPAKCTGCDRCIDYCRFDAIHLNATGSLEINQYQCEGCRLCERICPARAITSKENNNHHWYVSTSRFGMFVHASMEPGEENSGKLVTRVKKKGHEIVMDSQAAHMINDGPPGIGCASISSLSGADLVLIIVEPSNSGLHDAQRLMDLVRSFQIPACAVINKYDLSRDTANRIEEYLRSENIPVIGKLPFNAEVVEAVNNGKSIVEWDPASSTSKTIKEIWQVIKSYNNK